MAQISVSNLTFAYEGSFDYVFENVSFSIDSNWKLGLIGRNGKGKTTFLQLLLGKYEYRGSISKGIVYDYFPYKVLDADMEKNADELMEKWKPGVESWRVMCELPKLGMDAEILYRPFASLSFGERTKVMLAVLFSGEHDFLLIDEPTNHLDSNQAPQVNPLTLQYVSKNGQNRAVGALCTHTISIDGGTPHVIIYDSTVKWGYYNYKTVYLDLTAGQHEISLMYKGTDQNDKEIDSMLCVLLDKIDLSYAPIETAKIQVEPEELVGTQNGFSLEVNEDDSGAGSAVGSGNFDFYINAPKEGYYRLSSSGNGNAELMRKRFNYAKDARAESEVFMDWLPVCEVTLGSENSDILYLKEGINHLQLTGQNLILDSLTFKEESAENTDEKILTVEAENCTVSGTDFGDDYYYLPGSMAVPTVIDNIYASEEKVVEGFRGGKDNALSMTIDVEQEGNYILSIHYANNEPAPVMKTEDGKDYVHPYNTDLVERYMQISVNGTDPQTVYFKNTFCWDTFETTVIDINLKKGVNTVTFTNDNSYKFSEVQDDFTPRLDKFVIAPAQINTTESLTDCLNFID